MNDEYDNSAIFETMEWAKTWGVIALLGTLGIGIVTYGIWEHIRPREVMVEIIKEQGASNKAQTHGEVVVDVSGAVEKPGVYKLPSNSRIGDALVVAGGLSANADRSWVATTLNLAEKVEDGEKIYVPDISAVPQVSESVGQIGEKSANNKMNINIASEAELDKLEGIGEARAKAIVDNRPYSKTEEIVSKAKIPESVYAKIRDSISVY